MKKIVAVKEHSFRPSGAAGKLDGKVAVITGSSRGIGKAIAETFAREGAFVVVNYFHSASEASRVVNAIRSSAGKAIAVKADVSDRKQATHLIKRAISVFGRIDILVNNAGILKAGTTLDTKEEDWDRTMAVNLKGPFNCTQQAAKFMVAQGYGKIINISSVNGLGGGGKDALVYSCSKAGVISLTYYSAADLGRNGINVNCIAPGFIVTDMSAEEAGSEEKLRALKEMKAGISALKKVGDPEEVADVALFLASDDSKFVTGQVIVVDGGRQDFLSHA